MSDDDEIHHLFVYQARVTKVAGSFLELTLDLGLGVHMGISPWTRFKARLHGISEEAPEPAEHFIVCWCDVAFLGTLDKEWPLVVETEKGSEPGEWLVHVWRKCDGQSLNDELLEEQLAEEKEEE